MNATPTPGDMSARHVEVLQEYVGRYAGQIDNRGEYSSDLHTRALEAIAALSALPAAGGAKPRPVAWYVFAGTEHWVTLDEGDVDRNRADGCHVRPLVFGDTTPQPSAAEDGEERARRLYEPDEYEDAFKGRADAAVGAQGGGEKKGFRVFPLNIMGDPMREFAPGKWESAVWPSAAPAAGKGVDDLARIGELIRTQDNRITDSPIFIVQQKRVHVADPDYDNDGIVWVNDDHQEAGEAEHARLEAAFDGEEPEGWRRLAVRHEWEFVTACFTEQGCKDYIARDGHNLKEPRIYAAGSYRNEEWRTVRNFLAALTRQPVAGDGWLPIESAPRTSKAVLIYVSENKCAYTAIWREADEDRRGGWTIFGGDWREHLQRATHWQPLPAAPAATPTCAHEWVSGDNQYVSNTLICQRCYEIKPAATPTDGGEGS